MHTARHIHAEATSDYSWGDCELEQISADEREQEIWNDRELLSEAICGHWGDSVLTVRGERRYTDHRKALVELPAVTSGDEALTLLQRAYRTKSEDERRALIAEFGKKVYHDLIDFVEAQAAEA
jgi:hypothetical protein